MMGVDLQLATWVLGLGGVMGAVADDGRLLFASGHGLFIELEGN